MQLLANFLSNSLPFVGFLAKLQYVATQSISSTLIVSTFAASNHL